MERIKQRWASGPKARLLIIFAACLPVIVVMAGCAVSIGLIAYVMISRYG